MPLVIQDPSAPSPNFLLNELERHFKDAEVIYCAFAFVTASGVNLLFDQPGVKDNLNKAKINLVIGMDAITDTRAIDKLSNLSSAFNNFNVQVFLPKATGIFHPKFSWIKKGESGVVITGSGNLTNGGLKNNIEAFSVIDIDRQALNVIEGNWKKFLADNSNNLFALDAQVVIDAAEKNARFKQAVKKIRKEIGNNITSDSIPVSGAVFIEELTKGRGGKQRDVGKWAADNYFGKEHKLFLTYINDQGHRSEEETRRVSIKGSVNFAIDLDASKGLIPISGQMPIAVFIRTSPQNFLYHIASIDSPHYKTLSSYLKSEVSQVSAGKARRLNKETSAQDLRKNWPLSPFWSTEDDE